MLTKEKYVFLRAWGRHASENVCPPASACEISAIGGVIVGALPENHSLLSMPRLVAFGKLVDLSINQLTELRDSLT